MLIDESIMFRMKEASRDASDAADAALTSTSEAKRAADDYSSANATFANKWLNLKGLVESMKDESDFLLDEAIEMVSAADDALTDCKQAKEAARQVQREMDKLWNLFSGNL